MRLDLTYPFALDAARGATELATYGDHVRDLIEQTLVTNPGERVNRPDFGAGLMRAVFMPESDQSLATLRAVVLSNLQRWLAQMILRAAGSTHPPDTTLFR